jgi:transposase
VGVDDFALRKRLRYATVVIDMTAGRPIDVLADRRVGSTAAWLRAHPGVRVVCRDGSAAYAEAITQGAPRARQVSDRWHLWHGLSQGGAQGGRHPQWLLGQNQPGATERSARCHDP